MAGDGAEDWREVWHAQWSEGRIDFHLPAVCPDLERWYRRLVPDEQPRTVLVPLCGKSVDMVWLYQKGHTVIGIEGIEKAIVDFFTENNIDFSKIAVGSYTLYQTPDGRLRVYHADICRLDPETVGAVDAIWDRASYVAVRREDRPRYAAFLRAVMAPGCRYLLSSVEYEPNPFSGTPQSVTPADFRPEFEPVADIECLAVRDRAPDAIRPLAAWDVRGLQENMYLMTRK
ncbi:probable thiopurine S-methyltransferase [Pollicipes pollicipes]|uniref:probable thiopurine S-methyltransferase n=1 Tax=Pollicipes pollicipes TaxID=41117 RepID=UPI0018852818|nr:probable thiopurine S-methyltransferase [Pollicipes pollicipes]